MFGLKLNTYEYFQLLEVVDRDTPSSGWKFDFFNFAP